MAKDTDRKVAHSNKGGRGIATNEGRSFDGYRRGRLALHGYGCSPGTTSGSTAGNGIDAACINGQGGTSRRTVVPYVIGGSRGGQGVLCPITNDGRTVDGDGRSRLYSDRE